MGFKLKAPYQSHNIPVHEVPFSYDNNKAASDGLVAKANDNFSIIVNKNKTHDTKLMAAAMSHEGEHLRQMFGIGKYEPGDLKYGPGGVEFKGKFHDRNSPSFNEADRNLPYEKPAYAAGESFKSIDDIKPENMKDQVAFYSMGSRKGNDEDTVSSTENFGPAKKTWSPISFTNDYGELISTESEGDDKKVQEKKLNEIKGEDKDYGMSGYISVDFTNELGEGLQVFKPQNTTVGGSRKYYYTDKSGNKVEVTKEQYLEKLSNKGGNPEGSFRKTEDDDIIGGRT